MCPFHVAWLPHSKATSRCLDFLHKHSWYRGQAEAVSLSMTQPPKSHSVTSSVLYCLSNQCPPRNKGSGIGLYPPTGEWRDHTIECMDRSYLEISGRCHLPQIPAEGRSAWAVVTGLSLNSLRKRIREFASGMHTGLQHSGS